MFLTEPPVTTVRLRVNMKSEQLSPSSNGEGKIWKIRLRMLRAFVLDKDGIRLGLIRDVANRVSTSAVRNAVAECRLVSGSVTVTLVFEASMNHGVFHIAMQTGGFVVQSQLQKH